MKPKTQYNHRAISAKWLLVPVLATTLVRAQSGTWIDTTTSGTNWSENTYAWNANMVADGAGNTADFSTADIPGPYSVSLDTNRTIGHLTFGDADPGTPGTWTISQPATNILTLDAASPVISTAVDATIAPSLAGTAGFTKNGSAKLTLSAANTFTGSLTVQAGNLVLNNTNAYAGGTTIASGATLTLGHGSSFGTGGLGTGTLELMGTLNSTMPSGNTLVYSQTINIGTGETGAINTPNRFQLNGAVTGGGVLNMNIITNTSRADFRNNFVAFTGHLNLTGSGQNRWVINGGTFAAAGLKNTTLDLAGTVNVSVVTNSGGNTLEIGALKGSSATAYLGGGTAGTATYSIGSVASNTTFDGGIQGNSALTKTGTGTLTLTNATLLTYSGTTTVSGGALHVTGTKTGTGATSVNAGATLAGTGTWAGTTTVANGGMVSPGISGIGNLTFGNLTLNSGSQLDVEFGAGNDTVTVSSGGTLVLGTGATVDVNGLATDGAYTIIDTTGVTVSGTPSTALSAVNGALGKIYAFSSTASAIILTVSSSDPNNFWVPDGGGSWGTAANWTKNSVPDAAEAIARVGAGPGGTGGDFTSPLINITLDANRTVGTLVLNGLSSIMKSDLTVEPGAGGDLLFDNAAAASVITSSNGNHAITANAVVDAGGLAIDVSDSAATPLPAVSTLTMSGIISGASAAVVKNGASILALTGVNTYGGGTIVNNGRLAIISDHNLGDTAAPLTFAGGILQLQDNVTGMTRDMEITSANHASILTNGFTLDYEGVISPLSGATGGLMKQGTGTLKLSQPQMYTGTTTVGLSTSEQGGLLELLPGSSITGTHSLINYGKLLVSGGSITHTATSGISLAGVLEMTSGTATFAGINSNTANGNGNHFIHLTGGTFQATFISMGRGATPYTSATVAPGAGHNNHGLYVNGATATLTGNLDIGQNNTGTNSTANARIDSGSLTVDGGVGVSISSPDRWSILDVNGGTFTSTNAVTGVRIGTGQAGSVAFLVRNGVATAERILLQQPAASTRTSLLHLTGGALYVGAGGIVGENNAGNGIIDVRLGGGTLGAKADWTSSVAMTLTGTATIQAEDASATAHNITLDGILGGSGDMVKTGAGTVALTAANTYTGNTTVHAGTLSISHAYLADASTVSIDSGAVMNLNYTGTDTVESLMLDGSPAAAGSWGATGSGATNINDVYFTGTGTITVAAGGYASWAALPANGLTAGVNDGSTADPDHDGISNLLEFVLDGNPMISSRNILPSQVITPSGMEFTFTRRDDSETEVTLIVQHGSDLVGWTDIPIGAASAGVVAVSENGELPDTITVTIPTGTNLSCFARLKAVK